MEGDGMSDARVPIVGGLYASRSDDGRYRVSKVLVVDEFAVHLRSYANQFKELPTGINSSQLSLGGFGSPDGIGIGHFPIAHEGFWLHNPLLIGQESVEVDELDGYRIWAGIDPIE
jgi:hypothetical protein